ncbi:hypothetical protein FQN49_005166 [Arthroderma sp. PD_2]|nr:hypothetical protein FQN49_005166 [Arthroderma sp. PD_2]
MEPEHCLSSSPKRSRLEFGPWAFRLKNQLGETSSDSSDSDVISSSKLPSSTASTEPNPTARRKVASEHPSGELSKSDTSSSSFSSSTDSESEPESEEDEADDSSDDAPSGNDERMHSRTNHVPSRPSAHIPNNSALRARLASFLPSLKAANEDLERDIAAGKMMGLEVDSEEEGQGQYIEMNLGLGVLQEGEDEDGEQSSEENESSESSASSGSSGKPTKQEKNIISKLMGNKADQQKPKIEEMGS